MFDEPQWARRRTVVVAAIAKGVLNDCGRRLPDLRRAVAKLVPELVGEINPTFQPLPHACAKFLHALIVYIRQGFDQPGADLVALREFVFEIINMRAMAVGAARAQNEAHQHSADSNSEDFEGSEDEDDDSIDFAAEFEPGDADQDDALSGDEADDAEDEDSASEHEQEPSVGDGADDAGDEDG